MPNFIDLFGKEIENNKTKFIQYLTKGVNLKALKSEYEKQFNKYYISLGDIRSYENNLNTIAIDASGKKREFSNGIFFYLNRASGIQNDGLILRELETDVFSTNGSEFEVNTYFGRKAEYLELKVVEQYVEAQQKSEKLKVCFLDGSLYSRLMSHIVESPIDENETFIFQYFEQLFKILNKAKKKNIILLGLSKDSRDNFFRNALLDEIYYEEREKIADLVNENEINLINNVIKKIDILRETTISKFKDLIDIKGDILRKIADIYKEYKILRTDWELIYRFSNVPGFTHPMEKGLGRIEQKRIFNEMIKNPRNYIATRFRNYISNLNKTEKSQFFDYSIKIIKKFLEVPTFISFHILIDIRDNPIKIDIPSWYFKNWNYLYEFHFVDFVEFIDPLLEELISYIIKLYGGPENYNILLSAAHDDVVLRNRVYSEIYERCLQDKLNILLKYKRRIKRTL